MPSEDAGRTLLSGTDGSSSLLPASPPLDPALRLFFYPIASVDPHAIHPEEAACLPAASVEARRREFAGGRFCARGAMHALGLDAAAVPIGPDRAPAWPHGVVGSISHSKLFAGAAVALRTSGIRAVGLDIEEALPLEDELHPEILGEDERAWLQSRPVGERGLHAKAIFCIKEAVYKCQYPLSRRILEFSALHVDLSLPDGRFSARFRQDAEPFLRGDRLDGVLWNSGDHMIALLAMR